jgi:hypothetical protein
VRFPPRRQLPLPRRLRGPRETIVGDHLVVVMLQDQVSREFLLVERESRVCECYAR